MICAEGLADSEVIERVCVSSLCLLEVEAARYTDVAVEKFQELGIMR